MTKPILYSLLLFTGLISAGEYRKPLKADLSHSASYRWLNKKVLGSRILDDMESLHHWTTFTNGAQQVVDARMESKVKESSHNATEMTLEEEKKKEGNHSIRMRMPTRLEAAGPESGRGWGTTGIKRKFDNEDWTASNRISIWIYPDCPGFYVNWIELRLYNDGVEKLPALFGQEGETSLLLRNFEWNHVVWEIGNVARDRITGLEVSYYMAGNEPDATDTATYYVDLLELQQVEPDHIEGWDVWPGRISFSHSGYQPGSEKTAIASGLKSKDFRVINQETGEIVMTRAIETIKAHLGEFNVMDFSGLSQRGTFLLESGNIRTGSFRIGEDVWRETILKTLNFFYMERCGTAIPGVHGICHRDWRSVHDGEQIIINGGWHDAGDLTQGLGNTSEAVYSMFSLAEHLQQRDDDPELLDRVLEEGLWGLDWILKTSFRDGYRNGGSVSTRRTNGIIGDTDDVIAHARNSPMDHLVAAAAEAIAARVLRRENPRLASFSLEMAKEDWEFALEGITLETGNGNGSMFRGNFDSDNVAHEIPSTGIVAAVDLWTITGDPRYAEKAFEWADIIVNSQQKKRPDWDVPLTGFFYTGPLKERLLHYVHKGREHMPVQALWTLCENFPDHPRWIEWYATIALHSEYLKRIAQYTAPYYVFPASVYQDEEYLGAPESRRKSFRNQVLEGIRLDEHHYLRLFPVWMDYRGHFGTILSQAQAISLGGKLRNDPESIRLARHNTEWIIGRNPFSQSTMWGEGYDFPPLYSVMSGDMTGGLPVGIQTRGDHDVPYWPVQNSWTYKEIWVYPVIRWIGLMPGISGEAIINGSAGSAVTFTVMPSGQKIPVRPDPYTGRFRTVVPEGNYRIESEAGSITRSFLPGGIYELDLRKNRILDFDISLSDSGLKNPVIRVTATGSGEHSLHIRAENLSVKDEVRKFVLEPGKKQSFEWRARIVDQDTPWIAVVIPDNNLQGIKEISNVQ